jgi:hypothetical protein
VKDSNFAGSVTFWSYLIDIGIDIDIGYWWESQRERDH